MLRSHFFGDEIEQQRVFLSQSRGNFVSVPWRFQDPGALLEVFPAIYFSGVLPFCFLSWEAFPPGEALVYLRAVEDRCG